MSVAFTAASSFGADAQKTLFRAPLPLPNRTGTTEYSVSEDGSRFLFSRRAGCPDPLRSLDRIYGRPGGLHQLRGFDTALQPMTCPVGSRTRESELIPEVSGVSSSFK